ncbi:MAG: flavodoxin domain-containing protein [Ardenticatenaceae bacterium]|nr:flavodoxin domain-containing protein [Ardenticatenaceae bacterium]
MKNQTLIAYATKHGATAEIAEKIGQILNDRGCSVDLMPVDQVRDLSPYSSVVLGSAVYIGQWRREAVRFLRANKKALAQKKVWLFASGPTGDIEPDETRAEFQFPKNLKPVTERIQPQSMVVFHGDLEPDKLNWVESWMIKKVEAPVGDFRDWEAIEAWAQSIANVLLEKTIAQSEPV